MKGGQDLALTKGLRTKRLQNPLGESVENASASVIEILIRQARDLAEPAAITGPRDRRATVRVGLWDQQQRPLASSPAPTDARRIALTAARSV